METKDAIAALAALAHDSRIAVFRLLVRSGPNGMAAGEIGAALDLPPATLSFHLAHLERAGLVSRRRDGRRLIYAVAFNGLIEVLQYLVEDCCQGQGRIAACLPGAASACCSPTTEESTGRCDRPSGETK